MKSEVKDRLITGLSQYIFAQSDGSVRFAVADGYLAIDNYFSALLIDSGIDPTKNHKKKLDLVFDNFNNILIEVKIPKSDLLDYYDCWQNVRYSSKIPTPNETLKFLRLSHKIITAISGELAKRYNKSSDQLEDELYAEVMGEHWTSFDEEISIIHERWQHEAESQGERGYGSKLGNKMLNPSNYCNIFAFADDEITREIIAKDQEFGSKIANYYETFLDLIVYVLYARAKRGVKENEITNFMLSLRLRYHGQSMKEIAEDWFKMVSDTLKLIDKKSSANKEYDGNGAQGVLWSIQNRRSAVF